MFDVVSRSVVSESEHSTIQWGRALGKLLRPGAVIALMGDLGAGKTRFVKGLALGLDVSPQDRVTSPTFALIHEHRGRIALFHMDFYRLPPGSWETELGLEEYLWGRGVCAIEWADRIEQWLPEDRLDVRMTILGSQKRRIVMTAHGKSHAAYLDPLPATEESEEETDPGD